MAIEQPSDAPLESVTYYTVEGYANEESIVVGGVHDVDHGFELVFSDERTFTAVWNFLLPTTWVSFSEHPMWRVRKIDGCGSVDTSGWPDWAPLLGRSCSVTPIWGPKPEAAGRTDVGFSLDFSSGESVAVLLGAIDDDDSIKYQPDNLVVIFDRKLAVEYIADMQSDIDE